METLPPGFAPDDEGDPRCERVRRETDEKLTAVGKGWAGFEKARRLLSFGFDRSRPWRRRALALGALAYFLAPLDVIPDFLPGGLLDDLAILGFVAAQVLDEFVVVRGRDSG